MTIIKHGTPPHEPRFLFECYNCGCEFIMTQTELREKYQSLIYVATWACPDCGVRVQGTLIEETNNE